GNRAPERWHGRCNEAPARVDVIRAAASLPTSADQRGDMHDTNTANVQDTLELESFEYSDFQQGESEVFDEAQEMELAAELVAVGDEAELDQFLGSLIKQAG